MGMGQLTHFVIHMCFTLLYAHTGNLALGDLSSVLRIWKMTRKMMAIVDMRTVIQLIQLMFRNMAIQVCSKSNMHVVTTYNNT